MDTPITHINLFNALLALYVIGYQISICSDWSWIPMNKEDYQLPYQDKWSRTTQYIILKRSRYKLNNKKIHPNMFIRILKLINIYK